MATITTFLVFGAVGSAVGKSKVKGQRRKEDFVELASQPTQIPAQNPANEYRVATPFPGVSLTTSTFPPPTYTHTYTQRVQEQALTAL